MKLEKIYSENLIFSGDIEDDRTNTYLQLNDYDWMNYILTTSFKTKKMGQLNVTFEYFGAVFSTMKVEQVLGKKHKEITYEYNSDIFKKYIIKFLEKHISFWNKPYAFNGEEEVVEFFNDVIQNGMITDEKYI